MELKQQSSEATIQLAIITQTEAIPALAVEQPTLIQQADAELLRLRDERHRLAEETRQRHTESAVINGRLRENGVPLAEVERLQARRAALLQANANSTAADQGLEREVVDATERRAALMREQKALKPLLAELKGKVFEQRTRERDAKAEAELAARIAEQAEEQLRGVTARLGELGPPAPSNRGSGW